MGAPLHGRDRRLLPHERGGTSLQLFCPGRRHSVFLRDGRGLAVGQGRARVEGRWLQGPDDGSSVACKTDGQNASTCNNTRNTHHAPHDSRTEQGTHSDSEPAVATKAGTWPGTVEWRAAQGCVQWQGGPQLSRRMSRAIPYQQHPGCLMHLIVGRPRRFCVSCLSLTPRHPFATELDGTEMQSAARRDHAFRRPQGQDRDECWNRRQRPNGWIGIMFEAAGPDPHPFSSPTPRDSL